MKSKVVYVCNECGFQSAKWVGRCSGCGAWDSMEETTISPTPTTAPKRVSAVEGDGQAIPFSELELPAYMRSSTGLAEFDRVLGGGLVHGSVVLLAGEPGIGKSTLLMQITGALGKARRVLYVSGEESRGQLKLRAKRLAITGENLFILTETNLDRILAESDRIKPDIMIIDSIQTIYNEQSPSAPGSVTQVKDSALRFIGKAKAEGVSILIVGHVNKEGSIAGPKVLEHMVDAVLYFEGERQHVYRIIRAVKNRYGSTNEIGVFEMEDCGLREVPNPSELLLSGRPKNVSGNCAVCIMEGTRPIIAEVQALVSQSYLPSPKRTANGVDYNRMFLLLAVLEKRLGKRFSTQDAYLNVVGGLRMDEPAADLGVALALLSSLSDKPLPDDLLAVGEVGLAGEIRAVPCIEQRIREAARLGFTKILIPKRSLDRQPIEIEGIEIIPVRAIFDAMLAVEKAAGGQE